jgi:tetratricopeptide (TPR) repeat protein
MPALASLMAGEDPDRISAFHGDMVRLPQEIPTLAEQLRQSGYSTTAFVGEGKITPETGIGRGFDRFISPSGPLRQAVLPTERARVKPRWSGLYPAAELVDVIARHLRKQTLETRFFVWLHVGDLVQIGNVEDDSEDAYLRRLAAVDDLLGGIEDALVTYGLSERTVLAVSSLHGLSLGQAGEAGHGLSLSEEVVRVPAFVRGPGTERLDTSAGPSSLSDLGSMLLDILGVRTSRAEESPVFVGTMLPARQYGWPPLAAAGSREGWLRAGEELRWGPSLSEASSAGDGARSGAPASLLERIDAAGFAPSEREHTAPEPERRERVLELVRKAHAASTAERPEEALHAAEQAMDLVPQAPGPRSAAVMLWAALPRDERERQLPLLERALTELAQLAEDDLVRQVDYARALVRAGRCEDALAVVRKLRQLDPPPGPRLAVATIAASCKARESAVELIESVAEAEKSAPALREWMGDLLAQDGNAFRARQAYELAREERAFEDPQLLAKLGDQLAELGELEAALQRYAKAVEIDDQYAYPHSRAAEVLASMGQREAAAHALIQSLPKLDDPVKMAVMRSRALHKQDLTEFARYELERVMEQKPGNVILGVRLANLEVASGELSAARERLEALLQDHPEDPRVLVHLARVAAMAGDVGRASALLQRAEPLAGPVLTRIVQNAPAFQRGGRDTPLARQASRFTGQAPPVTGPEGGDAEGS